MKTKQIFILVVALFAINFITASKSANFDVVKNTYSTKETSSVGNQKQIGPVFTKNKDTYKPSRINAINGCKEGFLNLKKKVIPPTILTIPKVFQTNMVLQQDMDLPLWGWAPANKTIQITLTLNPNKDPVTVTATSDSNGDWYTTIKTPKATKGPTFPSYTLRFQEGTTTINLTNLLVGDVWLCSGQSNMDRGLDDAANSTTEIAAANYKNIRLCKIDLNLSSVKLTDVKSATWSECNSTTVEKFSAVAYYFGRELHLDPNINIPIGLICSAYGGSSAEAWTSAVSLENNATLNKTYLQPFIQFPATFKTEQKKPAHTYNAMLFPILKFGIKGAIWYQGEANNADWSTYNELFMNMIVNWRTSWGIGDFPFYYVQLTACNKPNWENLREAQTKALSLKNTGMAVILDAGELENIHPSDKITPGTRLALWAKAKTYGQKIVFAGPIYKGNTIKDGTIIIDFYAETVGTGLKSNDGDPLTNFRIAGSSNTFFPATAVISGDSVIVSSTSVPNPTKVWFAHSNVAQPNLFNNEGLQACPFRTDTWNNLKIPSLNDTALGVKTDFKNEDGSIKITLNKDMLSANQLGTFTIHSIDGKLVLSAKNTDKIEISSLQTGTVHVLSFTNLKSNKFTKKIIF